MALALVVASCGAPARPPASQPPPSAHCEGESSCRAALQTASGADVLALRIDLGSALVAASDPSELVTLASALLDDLATYPDERERIAEAVAAWAQALHARVQAGEATLLSVTAALYAAWTQHFADHPRSGAVHLAYGQLLLYRSTTPARALPLLLEAARRASEPTMRTDALAGAIAAARQSDAADAAAALPTLADLVLEEATTPDTAQLVLGVLVLALGAHDRALAERLAARLDDEAVPASLRDAAHDLMAR